MTDDGEDEAAIAVRLSVRAALEEVSAVRHRLATAVISAGDDQALANDIALAASELSTNVIQYGNTDEFIVDCVRRHDRWVLQVSHFDGLDEIPSGTEDPSASSGRGLSIVRAVMDSVDLVDGEHGVAIRCVKSVK